MAIADAAVAPQDLRWHPALERANPEDLQWGYDPEADRFAISIRDAPPAYSIHCDEHLVLRLDLQSDIVVGLEVYGWERAFLKEHPELDIAWRATRSPLRRWLPGRPAARDILRGIASTTAKLIECSCSRLAFAG